MRTLKYIGMVLLSTILFSCTDSVTKETINFNIPKGFKLVNAVRDHRNINILLEPIIDSTYIPTTRVLVYVTTNSFQTFEQTFIFKEYGSEINIKNSDIDLYEANK